MVVASALVAELWRCSANWLVPEGLTEIPVFDADGFLSMHSDVVGFLDAMVGGRHGQSEDDLHHAPAAWSPFEIG